MVWSRFLTDRLGQSSALAVLALAAGLAGPGLGRLQGKRPITPEVAATIEVPHLEEFAWSPDSRRLGYIREGWLELYEIGSQVTRRLIELNALEKLAAAPVNPRVHSWENRRVREQKLQWFPDSRRLLVHVKGDLFELDVETGATRQLVKSPVAERDPKLSPDGQWIAYRVQSDLYVQNVATGRRERLTQSGSETIWNAQLDWVYPEELDLGTAYWWSPDSRWIAYLQFNVEPQLLYPHVDLQPLIPVYEPQRYPKAGTPNARVRLGVVARGGGRTRWLTSTAPDDSLIARVAWLPDSTRLAVLRLNRLQNRLWLEVYEARTGRRQTLLTEEDPYWINVSDAWGFLKAGRELLWSSERDGFRHLYRYSVDGTLLKQLTQGQWEVTELACIAEPAGEVYYVSTEPSPLERHLWVVPLAGGARRRITSEPGTHRVMASPDCRWMVDVHSAADRPPTAVVRSNTGEVVTVLEDGWKRLAQEYEFLPQEFHRVPVGQGPVLLDGCLIRPKGFAAGQKYPAVVLVYGGPQAQSVRNAWGGFSLGQVLAQKGFVVWQLDNRGASGRGHGFEVGLYRRLGKLELEDQLSGLDYLISLGFVDESRIGIHGWSYGGFLTLYALLHAPDRFRAGAAGAPVTDWRHYDTIYTERYLGLPAQNEEGYRASSPVHFVENLRAPLLLIHNFEDDNVLFQNVMQLVVALARAGKPFELLVYPQKSHGVSGPFRRHYYEQLVRFFERHLMAAAAN